ncbi:MAG: hypothetical protein OEV08_07475 [Nitrospira sp.]|nr:hypothetical protein [Nitrospira sp.]
MDQATKQAEREAQAREWLFENIGPCDIDSELNKSLVALLAANERAVLEEIEMAYLRWCENSVPKAGHWFHPGPFSDWFRQRAKEVQG